MKMVREYLKDKKIKMQHLYLSYLEQSQFAPQLGQEIHTF
jgi:hypothetical protein